MKLGSYGRFGILLAGIGILLAIDSLVKQAFIYKLWPLLVTVLGIGFIGIYIRRCRREAIYIGIGVYIIGFSALALYCSLTSWSSLGTLWPVFIGLMGLSFLFGYIFGNRRPALLLGGLLFLTLAVLFYSLFGLKSQVWWIVFFLAGASFLIFDKVRRS
jgi:hypothetical protein